MQGGIDNAFDARVLENVAALRTTDDCDGGVVVGSTACYDCLHFALFYEEVVQVAVGGGISHVCKLVQISQGISSEVGIWVEGKRTSVIALEENAYGGKLARSP